MLHGIFLSGEAATFGCIRNSWLPDIGNDTLLGGNTIYDERAFVLETPSPE